MWANIERKDLFEERTKLIESDSKSYLEILAKVDEREREKNTFCFGVNWKLYDRITLLEIAEVTITFHLYHFTSSNHVQCIGGQALGKFGQILAEDYSNRASGMPDLWYNLKPAFFNQTSLWNYETKSVCLVEGILYLLHSSHTYSPLEK